MPLESGWKDTIFFSTRLHSLNFTGMSLFVESLMLVWMCGPNSWVYGGNGFMCWRWLYVYLGFGHVVLLCWTREWFLILWGFIVLYLRIRKKACVGIGLLNLCCCCGISIWYCVLCLCYWKIFCEEFEVLLLVMCSWGVWFLISILLLEKSSEVLMIWICKKLGFMASKFLCLLGFVPASPAQWLRSLI